MMKDIRPALRAFMLGDAAIASRVLTRIYPLKLPQGVTGDSIVYTRVSAISGHSMAGRDGLARVRMQIDAWATTGDAAASLANLIKDRIDGYKGTMGAGDAAVMVGGVFFDGERDDHDDAAKLYRTSRDYRIWHDEI
ncbi:MAG: tail completion protein gp17 [Pseudomonadota bacterium]